jgi:hypothetical protein
MGLLGKFCTGSVLCAQPVETAIIENANPTDTRILLSLYMSTPWLKKT